MKLSSSLRLFQVVFLSLVSLVSAGPGGHLELINLTPYNWKLVWQHEYHMDWHPKDLIPAGAKHKQYVEWWYHWGNTGDCGAEAIYRLEGTEYEFTIQARQHNGKRLLVEYNDALAAMTITKEKVIELGFDHDGSVLFVLSGDDVEPYVSSQAPKNWMQMTLPTIGSKELRQISMPMSHNAGIYKVSHHYLGNAHNPQCQTPPIYSQLSFGTRWFDLRPAFARGKWLTVHASKASTGDYVGVTGAEWSDIINDINRFTAETPGEFIVLQIGHELDAVDSGGFHPLRNGLPAHRWQEIYKLLEGINDLWEPKDSLIPHDISTMRMSSFIEPGSKSAVVVRIPNHAPLPESSNPAFVHEDRLVWTGGGIQTVDPAILDAEATCDLNAEGKYPKSPLFRLPYTITPRISDMLDIANGLHSILGKSMWAEHKLHQTIWDKLTPNTYPNLIEVDNIHNSQITAISMVINQRYANTPENNVKREQPILRNQLIKLSARDLMAEELLETTTPKELEELDILASRRSSLLAEQTSMLETGSANLNSLATSWPVIVVIHTTTITSLSGSGTPTPTTPTLSFADIEPRARGPKRKDDHVWLTGEKVWNTKSRGWNTGTQKIWCTGSRPYQVEYTPIATIVYEFIGTTRSSYSTMTLTAIDTNVPDWYPYPSPASSTYVEVDQTSYWFTVPTSPTPTPTPTIMTIRIVKESWDASTAPLVWPEFACGITYGVGL